MHARWPLICCTPGKLSVLQDGHALRMLFKGSVATKAFSGGDDLTLPMVRLPLSKYKDHRIIKIHLNPVMLVFIG